MISVQSVRDGPLRINRIHEWVGVDAHTRSVNYKLIKRRQSLQEKLNSRPHQHENLDRSTLKADPHLKVSFAPRTTCLQLCGGKLAVDQSLVQVQDQSLPAFVLRLLCWDNRKLLQARLLTEPSSSVQFRNYLTRKEELLFQNLSCRLRCNPLFLLCRLLIVHDLLWHLLFLSRRHTLETLRALLNCFSSRLRSISASA